MSSSYISKSSFVVTTALLLVTASAFTPQRNSLQRIGNNAPPIFSTVTRSDASSDASVSSKDVAAAPEQKKLSRPERKALEREQKQNRYSNSNSKRYRQRRKHQTPAANGEKKGEGPYDLNSNAVKKLTKESTADDVLRAIKRAQNMHDHHDIRHIENFLIDEVDEHFAYGYRGSLLSRLAVAALHMEDVDMALKAIEIRHTEHRSTMLPLESAAIVRGLLRMHKVSDAINVLDDELSLPLPGTPVDTPESQEKIKHRVLAMASMISRHFFEFEPHLAVKFCQKLVEIGPLVHESGLTTDTLGMPWLRLIQGAAKCESERRAERINEEEHGDVELPCNLVYSVLDAMSVFPSGNSDEVYEALSNALVRRTIFVDGVVNIGGLPEADRGEVVFIGRSNVGKSSLVNMVTNRKSLAYTSKRPGKTQQFNYFAVNDKPEKEREIKYGDEIEGEKDKDSFYIVDFPGFGFAQVPQQQRQKWVEFTNEYISKRENLKVVFHLVDARHGPTSEDEKIMKQMSENLRKGVTYAIVLTKADKNGKNKEGKKGQVSKKVMEKLRQSMSQAKVGDSPVILTSSETKLGRDDIWRYLKHAAQS